MNKTATQHLIAAWMTLGALTSTAAQAQLATPAPAGTIIGATSVTTTMGTLDDSKYAIGQVISQNGLDQTYTSGVTDFRTFYNSTGHGTSSGVGVFYAANNVKTGSVTFDFGRTVVIDGIALWNNQFDYAVAAFSLYDSNDSLIGSFEASRYTITGQPKFFAPVETSSVRMDITQNYGAAFTGFNEVAFRAGTLVTAVPEPGTWVLMAAGLGAVGFMARRQRSA